MDLLKTKTAWLGIGSFIAGLLQGIAPELAGALGITIPADQLILIGLGLVTGRDALRKIER